MRNTLGCRASISVRWSLTFKPAIQREIGRLSVGPLGVFTRPIHRTRQFSRAPALGSVASVCYGERRSCLDGTCAGMAASALIPRVRLATVCDRARESPTEAGVYHLRGVRQRIMAPAFPFSPYRLWLFLVLSSPRPGTYPGYVRVLDEATDKAVLFAHLAPHPRFQAGEDTLAAAARLPCSIPHAGRYTVQVWFCQKQGSDVLKAELPISVVMEGE